MTRYEQGFLTKCAEYGVDGRYILKLAQAMANDRGLPGTWFGRNIGAPVRQIGKAVRSTFTGGPPGTMVGRAWHRVWHGPSVKTNGQQQTQPQPGPVPQPQPQPQPVISPIRGR